MPSIILKETTLVVLSSHFFGLTDTGGGGGVLPYISYIGIFTPKGMVFGLKTGMHFAHLNL